MLEVWTEHTWELRFVLLHIFQHVLISADDNKAMLEDINDSTNVEVLRTIECGLVRGRAGLCHPGSFQELSSNDTRVPNRRFIDCHHVISQSVAYDESTSIILRPDRILEYKTQWSRLTFHAQKCHQFSRIRGKWQWFAYHDCFKSKDFVVILQHLNEVFLGGLGNQRQAGL